MLFWTGDAEISELGHLVDERTWHVAAFWVELVGQGQHFLHREVACGFLQHAALGGEVSGVGFSGHGGSISFLEDDHATLP